MENLKKLVNEYGAFTICVIAMLTDRFDDFVTSAVGVEIAEYFKDEYYELEQVENEIYNYQGGLNDFINFIREKDYEEAINENYEDSGWLDYFKDKIKGEAMTLRKLLSYGLNAVYEGQIYRGYDEEDFTEEELNQVVLPYELDYDADGYMIVRYNLVENTLNENQGKGFTLEYPNGDFYIGKPHDLYILMTDFLIDWDNDKTTMTEYEAEDVASIRENYEKVFYAALEGGNYWEGQDFEETFGRHSEFGIANALAGETDLNENKTLTEDVSVINTVIWNGNTLEDWARNDGWNLDRLIDLLVSEDWVWQDLFDIIDGRTLTATELNDFLRFDAEDIALEILGRDFDTPDLVENTLNENRKLTPVYRLELGAESEEEKVTVDVYNIIFYTDLDEAKAAGEAHLLRESLKFLTSNYYIIYDVSDKLEQWEIDEIQQTGYTEAVADAGFSSQDKLIYESEDKLQEGLDDFEMDVEYVG